MEARERQAYSYRADPAVPAFPDDRPIIVFDGHCALCSGWAAIVLRHDHRERFRLLRAQSPLAGALYRHYGLDPTDYQSNILLADGRAYFEAEGSIRMAEGLGMPWSLAGALRILPRRWQEALYQFIARNRLRFFGRREACYLPDERSPSRLGRSHFLENSHPRRLWHLRGPANRAFGGR